ncbi:MAG: 2-dehydro-3-deoxy-D-gluconate 5-dehydrogenase KduD [Atribacterota bacterium]|jgi:2-deoxy-D-gluconate 3-dehydrogenase|nr:2-dehydro-3-deoxy-D-gluconate 5-dehydrogenase KduD [Atribacterota bacterium]MDD4895251.1 2-dehydro-3-deoxy-D-gluconate 5-dehydrogenase KduD [Atribacterota bacterium]MDD5637568.1 2-dehydro-3-deoxy-D-gluconate 5-dehydrogenase KduD [Atribacterota bacterium]
MILDGFILKNKVALVTGCTTGLGQGMSIGLAEAGADIVGIDFQADPTQTKTAIKKIGGNFLFLEENLLSIEPINSIIGRVVQEFGRLDILVNNAGIIRRADALDFAVKDWDEVMDINLKTVFFLCQSAGRQFIKQKSKGKIINIASMLSFQGGIRVPSYTASKSGVMGITRLLANEWAQYHINVNAIAPGYMATNNTAPLRKDKGRSAEILKRIPAGRWGTPEDLKGIAVFLASSASDYINGAIIPVDGGWLAR